MAIQQPQHSIEVFNKYPTEKFNLLIPVQTIQEISPLHKVIVNVVNIDPVPDRGKDCYKEKNGGLALTKKGLNKLMAAANIQVIDSRTVMPQKCKRCAEIARETKQAPQCGNCPAGDDVACQVTVAVPEPSGTWRMVRATKELRVSEEKLSMSDKQYDQFLPYRSEHAETKALNRALRAGLMVKSTYTAEELKKPFAVALVVPNLADPDMKRAIADRYAHSNMALFPGHAPLLPENAGGQEIKQLPADAIDITDEDDQDGAGEEEGFTGDNPPWLSEGEPSPDNPPLCGDCGYEIKPSGTWSIEAIIEYSIKAFGTQLCAKCQQKAKAYQGGGRR